jgi:hypothetical protein
VERQVDLVRMPSRAGGIKQIVSYLVASESFQRFEDAVDGTEREPRFLPEAPLTTEPGEGLEPSAEVLAQRDQIRCHGLLLIGVTGPTRRAPDGSRKGQTS